MAVVTSAPALALALAIALSVTPPDAGAAPAADVKSSAAYDGLQPIQVRGIELAFARPGATLAGYRRILLDPVEVAFRKDWNPHRAATDRVLSTAEREAIRTAMAKIVLDEFAGQLQSAGGYPVVDVAGPDVLRIRTRIADLVVTAPATLSAASGTYTLSAGEATLFAELYDSDTGQLLARVVDRREARGTGTLMLVNQEVNVREAKHMAATWARVLRTGLDRAHGIAAPESKPAGR